MAKASKVIIRHAGFGYRTKDMEDVAPHLVAIRGEELDVSTIKDSDRKRGERIGAWGEPTAAAPAEPEDGTKAPDPAPFTDVPELSAWLKANQPNATDTVALVGPEDGPDAVERATLLLQAEEDATGGKARKSVREPLEAIIAANDGGEAAQQQGAADAAQAKADADAKA